jgi:adenylosuccinate synthase
MPDDQSDYHHAKPVYEYLDGWTEDISGARELADLPVNAQRYLARLEEISGTRISAVGVGPGREATVAIHDLLG